MKPAYKIALIVLITVLVGLIVYFAWNSFVDTGAQPPAETTLPAGGEVPGGTLPGSEGAGGKTDGAPATEGGESTETASRIARAMSDSSAFDFLISPSGEVFYFGLDGKVYIAKEGPDLTVSEQTVDALNAVVPSPSKERALVSFGDPRSPQWGIFDTVDRVWRPLPSDIRTAAWGMNDDALIAAISVSGGTQLASIDLSKNPAARKVILSSFLFKDVDFSAKSADEILVLERASASYPSSLWQLNTKTLSFATLAAPQNGLLFSLADHKQFGFLFSAPRRFSLVSKNLSELVPVFFTTFPSKCGSEATSTAYCFAPREDSSFDNAVLPDDYQKNGLYTIDDLYAVHIDGEYAEKIAEDGASLPHIDAFHPRLRGNLLYFINRYDRKVYELALP